MGITLIRIDDRLIHGQVVEGWLRHLNVNCIFVANSAVANDEMQCSLYNISVPSGVRVECFPVERAVPELLSGSLQDYSVLVLVSSPQDALTLVKKGLRVPSINVGGMHYSPGKQQLMKSFSVNESDVEALIELSRYNIELEGRVLPQDERVNILEVLRNFKK
ncbi:MAG: PTS sugar transporter subunit IIB [Elusimicrobiota bacterium]